jgi:hypothetical protein
LGSRKIAVHDSHHDALEAHDDHEVVMALFFVVLVVFVLIARGLRDTYTTGSPALLDAAPAWKVERGTR